MRIRTLTVIFTALALLLGACGGEQEPPAQETGDTETGEQGADDAATDEETAEEDAAAVTLDCPAVQVIVPYSPGGGSDQQVRRLQVALEEALGARLNITYQTGGDGSVGWNALADAGPDGCTVANVVSPNISNLSLTAGEDIGFAAEDFEYVAWTEYSPNIIGVAIDSEFETIEDFIQEAEARPGELTISGVGQNGELLVSEVLEATGLELAFVPVSGGVGEIIPQVAGGHVDAAISGFSLLDGDQLRPLVLSGTEPSPDFPDVPTFDEAGYSGVELVTSWGLILPPGTPQDIVEAWNAAVQQSMRSEDVQAAYAETPLTVLEQDTTEAREYFEQQHEATRGALGM